MWTATGRKRNTISFVHRPMLIMTNNISLATAQLNAL